MDNRLRLRHDIRFIWRGCIRHYHLRLAPRHCQLWMKKTVCLLYLFWKDFGYEEKDFICADLSLDWEHSKMLFESVWFQPNIKVSSQMDFMIRVSSYQPNDAHHHGIRNQIIMYLSHCLIGPPERLFYIMSQKKDCSRHYHRKLTIFCVARY